MTARTTSYVNHRGRGRASGCAILTIVALMLGTSSPGLLSVAAEPSSGVATMEAKLQPPRAWAAAVYCGGEHILLGGWSSTSTQFNDIDKYHPDTDAITASMQTLPEPQVSRGACSGDMIYLLGGYRASQGIPSGVRDHILRYDPASDTLETMPLSLPSPRYEGHVGTIAGKLYYIGGFLSPYCGNCDTAEIVEYDPAIAAANALATTMPFTIAGGGYAATDDAVYVLGGLHGNARVATIMRYTPGTDEAETMTASLPSARHGAAAAWDGNSIYIFGGYDGSYRNDIIRYDPATDTIQTLPETMPAGFYAGRANWDGEAFYVFGGRGSSGGPLDTIVRYVPEKVVVAPSAPQSVAAAPAASAIVQVTWDPPADDGGAEVSSYTIARSSTSGGPYTDIGTSSDFAFSDTGLPAGATYHYVVRAHNEAGASPNSNEATATTWDLPAAPSSLTATPSNVGELSLTWDAPSDDGGTEVTNYNIQRSDTPGGPYTTIANPTTPTYTDTNLPDGTTYHYVVTATNAIGDSPTSNEATATTWDLPAAPADVEASAGPGAGEVSLSWTAPNSDGGTPVMSYEVRRSISTGGPYSIVGTPSGTSFTDTGLADATTYHYTVAAVNAVGTGPDSAEASVTTFGLPDAPTDVKAVAGPGAGEVAVEWVAPLSDGGTPVTRYRVHRSMEADGPFSEVTTTTGLSVIDSGLAEGTEYWYVISAENIVGEGSQSEGDNATTFARPGAPTNVVAETDGFDFERIRVSWDAPDDDGGSPVTGYELYRGQDEDLANMTLVATVTGTTHREVPPSFGYWHYRVKAVNIVGAGAESDSDAAFGGRLLG